MRIYSMTATFGKLEHQTLTLEPGLNVITAPNEWGKSTWCAFLVSMLYGIATKERTKLGSIADKERYAPWSGSPMSGRMDLCWNGRDITIERRTKGRAVFGDFKAYETATGLPVPELTAANCGQMLLGVEKSVFTRAGFIRLTDLPVSDDEALRRRLNALVTTGDESGASDALEQKLRDLKNHCRYNKSGLLPQAEAQRSQLEQKLSQHRQLQQAFEQAEARQAETAATLERLQNHQIALEYAAAERNRQHIAQAAASRDALAQRLKQLQTQCLSLPAMEDAREQLRKLQSLQQSISDLQQQELQLPPAPAPAREKAPFHGLDANQTRATVDADIANYRGLKSLKSMIPWVLTAAAGLLCALVLAFLVHLRPIWCILPAVAGLIPLFLHTASHRDDRRQIIALESKYGTDDISLWQAAAQAHIQELEAYEAAAGEYLAARQSFDTARDQVHAATEALTGGAPLDQIRQKWEHVIHLHTELETVRREYRQACAHFDTLDAVVQDAPPPTQPDTLLLTPAQTAQEIGKALAAREQLHGLMGQYRGQMEALGQEQALVQQLEALQSRIRHLEDIYAAASIGLQTLTEASNRLQRKFAPRISQRAQTLFARLTGGRYDRLLLGEDLSVSAGAQDEDTLRSGLWRSDGTADQQYLALRLAVAEELTPQAPLVLDDALVRFDETRLALAMEILKEEAAQKQVIVFTCQGRENALV